MATLAVRAHKKGLELAGHIAADVPEPLVGDPHRLRQILVNLVGNAIKFTERGEVVLAVSWPERDRDPMSAADVGVALRRPRHGHRHPPRAAGEALPGVHAGRLVDDAQVRRHRARPGDLGAAGRADGRPHLGRERGRPRQHVPLHGPVRPRPCRAAASASRRTCCASLPVLVVDDNATNRPHPAGDARPTGACGRRRSTAARRRWRRSIKPHAAGEPFALVLLDAMMPEMDGFALAARIKQDPDLVGPILMMLSSAGHREDAARCRAARRRGLPDQADPPVDAARRDHGRSQSIAESPKTRPAVAAPESQSTRTPAARSCWPRTTRSISGWPSRCWRSAGIR